LHFAFCSLQFAVALLALSCIAPSVTQQVSSNGFASVQEGSYNGTLRLKNGNPRIETIAAPWRRQIEDDPNFLTRVGEKYFNIPEGSEFRYKYVAEDSVAKNIVLRYFASAPKPVIFAGWQLLFVFSEPRRSLTRVYASEVPLE
jgi:hypothetical protein